MYAVIKTGGKQYRVKKGDTVLVELLPNKVGDKADFKEILLVGEGNDVKIGQPVVASASVSTEVIAIEKGPKLIAYKRKRRKQYERKMGHRQPYTRLLITSIDNGSGQKEVLSDAEKKQILGNVGFRLGDAYAISTELTEGSSPKRGKLSETGKKAPAKKAPKATTKAAAPKKAVKAKK